MPCLAWLPVAPTKADEERPCQISVVGEQNEAWEHVQEELKENENIDLQLVKFTDYRQPIVALEDGSIDLHAALTEIFMDNVNEESGYSNTTIAYTTLNPLGIYSDKITDVSNWQMVLRWLYPMMCQMKAAHYYSYRPPV